MASAYAAAMIAMFENVTDGHFEQKMAPNPYWWQQLFCTIDSRNAAGFAEMLTADAQFRFGNTPAVQGSEAILAAVTGFFSLIQSSQHQIYETWCDNELAGCEGVVTYTRRDALVVSFPFANVFRLRGEKVCSYHIYIDISTLFTDPV